MVLVRRYSQLQVLNSLDTSTRVISKKDLRVVSQTTNHKFRQSWGEVLNSEILMTIYPNSVKLRQLVSHIKVIINHLSVLASQITWKSMMMDLG